MQAQLKYLTKKNNLPTRKTANYVLAKITLVPLLYFQMVFVDGKMCF